MAYEQFFRHPPEPWRNTEGIDHDEDSCVAPRKMGQPCPRPPIEGAPYPICVKHAAELFQFLHNGLARETPLASAIRALETYDSGEHNREVPVPGLGTPVVYYLRVGNHIKIGYSINLSARMRGYPPDAEILAIEPGTAELEKSRHDQFRHQLRMGREWFAPSLDLIMHIEELRAGRAVA